MKFRTHGNNNLKYFTNNTAGAHILANAEHSDWVWIPLAKNAPEALDALRLDDGSYAKTG